MLTHMFWAYGDLNPINILCAKSYINKGYDLNVWTYGKISNLPEGALLRDAREILPESCVFENVDNNFISFSDLFSYAVLVEKGGLYTDCDVIALYSPKSLPNYNFFVTGKDKFISNQNKVVLENMGPDVKISVCLMYCTLPNNPLLKAMLNYAISIPKDNFQPSSIGSPLATSFYKIYPQNENVQFYVMPVKFANPICNWEVPQCFFSDYFEFPKNSNFIHLTTTLWTPNIMRKYNESDYSKKSLIYKIKRLVEIGE